MLTCKSVLITGANRGIGLELVKQFAGMTSPPTHVFAGCRDPDTAEDLKNIASTSAAVTLVQFDVTDQNSINTAKSVVEDKLEGSGLNLLINNAGFRKGQALQDTTKEQMLKHFEVNAVGPLMITQTFLPLLQHAASLQPDEPLSCSRAAIIMISTGVASIGENSSAGSYPYRTSKAALNMIAMNLSIDLKSDGILCTAIHPGWVKTEMGGPNALISPEESAKGMLGTLATLRGDEGTGKFYHGTKGDIIGW